MLFGDCITIALIMLLILCINLYLTDLKVKKIEMYFKEKEDECIKTTNEILAQNGVIKKCAKCNSSAIIKHHPIIDAYGVFCKNDGCVNHRNYCEHWQNNYKSEEEAIFNWNMKQKKE